MWKVPGDKCTPIIHMAIADSNTANNFIVFRWDVVIGIRRPLRSQRVFLTSSHLTSQTLRGNSRRSRTVSTSIQNSRLLPPRTHYPESPSANKHSWTRNGGGNVWNNHWVFWTRWINASSTSSTTVGCTFQRTASGSGVRTVCVRTVRVREIGGSRMNSRNRRKHYARNGTQNGERLTYTRDTATAPVLQWGRWTRRGRGRGRGWKGKWEALRGSGGHQNKNIDVRVIEWWHSVTKQREHIYWKCEQSADLRYIQAF